MSSGVLLGATLGFLGGGAKDTASGSPRFRIASQAQILLSLLSLSRPIPATSIKCFQQILPNSPSSLTKSSRRRRHWDSFKGCLDRGFREGFKALKSLLATLCSCSSQEPLQTMHLLRRTTIFIRKMIYQHVYQRKE